MGTGAVWRKSSKSSGNTGDCVEVADNLRPKSTTWHRRLFCGVPGPLGAQPGTPERGSDGIGVRAAARIAANGITEAGAAHGWP
ncbi:DUF397 domain-containing protein [Micromonospora polyrhachis]|uniref:DUF397 domain-containing protein n=1 Tax=Micromonospora polyrhachis TaxID=1282883 RepID=UPI00160E0995